jgi:hypothetical protein
MAAVFVSLAGLVRDPVRLDVTVDAWTGPGGRVALIPLVGTDPDEWMTKVGAA